MKLLILSDLHANLPALEAVWEKERDSDAIVCAGDLVDWGFFPREVVQWCQTHGVLAVAGNHDHDICNAWDAWKQDGSLPKGTFCAQNLLQLTEREIAYLRCLPETRLVLLDGVTCYLKHYYNADEENRNALLERWCRYESLAAFEENWPAGAEGDGMRLLITGHSHQSWIYHVCREDYFVNPGSISYRVCSDSRAKNTDYAVLQDGELRLRHAEYDRRVFVPLLEHSGLNEQVKTAARYHLLEDLPVEAG